MQDGGNIVIASGLLIGLAYGAVALLSGFCLLSGLRGWWADGDSRLIRTYALALGTAVGGGVRAFIVVVSRAILICLSGQAAAARLV